MSASCGKLDALERTFLAQHGNELLLLGAGLGVSVEVDDVIEVARPGALGERPEFFGEGFDVVVGEHLDAFFRGVGIGMKNFDGVGRQDDALVGRQVELDARQRPCWRNRSLVADLALT